MYGTITLSSQQIEGCPVKTRGGINVTKDGVDVTRSDAIHCRPFHLSTPMMCAEPVLRAAEELQALKFLRCVNSTADAARLGSSPTERLQASAHSPAVRPQKIVLRLRDGSSR